MILNIIVSCKVKFEGSTTIIRLPFSFVLFEAVFEHLRDVDVVVLEDLPEDVSWLDVRTHKCHLLFAQELSRFVFLRIRHEN